MSTQYSPCPRIPEHSMNCATCETGSSVVVGTVIWLSDLRMFMLHISWGFRHCVVSLCIKPFLVCVYVRVKLPTSLSGEY